MSSAHPLPTFIHPMLARRAEPFDSDQHLFEVKWDGIRALAYVEAGGVRLVSRHGREMTDPFPELALLAQLPPGTVLDGELVMFDQGRPQLALIQGRHQLQSALKIRAAAQRAPCTYVVYDQLYDRYRSLLSQPLLVRRQILQAAVRDLDATRLVFSEGLVGRGLALYQRVIEQQLEGVMAKRLTSRYRPGGRGDAWLKIKPTSHAQHLSRKSKSPTRS